MKKTKLIALGTVAALALGVSSLQVAADNKNMNYSFDIKSYQRNDTTGTQYRQTTTERNTWKVRMYKSSEGTGTFTRYWLENEDYGNVSPSVNVKAGNGKAYSGRDYYIRADRDASSTNVRLAGENNNYSSNQYSAYGYWDEETGHNLPGAYTTYHTTDANELLGK
jgi:hypothetical protein